MRVEPKVRSNICITAHPGGCAAQVEQQIAHVRQRGPIAGGPRRALVIGCSNGYGLAARIVAAFGCGAGTVGVYLEKEPRGRRTGTAGWYNNIALERACAGAGLEAESVHGDAFADEVKQQAIEHIRAGDGGSVDLVIYSIAAPRRLDPDTGELYSTAIKPIGAPFSGISVDIHSGALTPVTAPPATEDEIAHTVKVMGGEDWARWIAALAQAEVLARGATTVALSYVGPGFTAPIYRDGTIGRAKQHLERTAHELARRYAGRELRALISVNKALVTRASAVIPAVTLYISLLYRVMQRKGLHEGCIQQMERLFAEFLYAGQPRPLDAEGRIRLDDWEMREDVQAEVAELWAQVSSGGLTRLPEIEAFRDEFLQHHGFNMPGVDYEAEVEL